jgi:hypothetical protein
MESGLCALNTNVYKSHEVRMRSERAGASGRCEGAAAATRLARRAADEIARKKRPRPRFRKPLEYRRSRVNCFVHPSSSCLTERIFTYPAQALALPLYPDYYTPSFLRDKFRCRTSPCRTLLDLPRPPSRPCPSRSCPHSRQHSACPDPRRRRPRPASTMPLSHPYPRPRTRYCSLLQTSANRKSDK